MEWIHLFVETGFRDCRRSARMRATVEEKGENKAARGRDRNTSTSRRSTGYCRTHTSHHGVFWGAGRGTLRAREAPTQPKPNQTTSRPSSRPSHPGQGERLTGAPRLRVGTGYVGFAGPGVPRGRGLLRAGVDDGLNDLT